MSASANIREKIFGLIARHPGGANVTSEVQLEYSALLSSFLSAGGDSSDIVVSIGAKLYGYVAPVSTTPSAPSSPKDPDVIIDFDYMRQFMKEVFIAYGCPEDRADISADVLIEADYRGIDSHGLGRLKPIYCDRIDNGILRATADIDVLAETDTTALVDGNLGMGLYVGPYCMQMAIDKAKKHGVGMVFSKNSTHYGIAGYYATMATEAGCVGMTGTNARPSIAPTYGVEPMLGTNPLTFGVPSSDPFPFVLDCATSVNQRGKIELYERMGKSTPKGCVIDQEGIERTDTVEILKDMVRGKCALTPMGGAGIELGGYKGYGWATVVELLCTAFQSGPFGEAICGMDRNTGKPIPMPLGHFFLAVDIAPLCPLETFKKNAGTLLQALRDSKKSPKGPGRIWTAGEPENDARTSRMAQNGMTVPASLQKNMILLREKFDVLQEKYPTFPFEK
uniref:Malate dehydrogenase n=1 Tax=Corethron hystrix TaxID=216773 RepID=A0A7S1BHK5_9STRA|mmetsp:Transcript_25985/g.59790  ORF Transcript_25985/g.59790 Transcript_25985/m.59790 type:complete len:451 (+) Transcript_25985:152-1504(+)